MTTNDNTWKVRGLQSLNLNAPGMPTQTSTILPSVKTSRDDKIIYADASSAPGNAVANWLDFSQDLFRPAVDGYYGKSKERGIGPVAVTTCVDVAGQLAGMQVFFGQYMQKAGAAHGDLSGTCTKTALAAPIQCIEFYYNTPVGSTTQTLVGVNATMWPDRDVADGQTSITAGKVGTLDDTMFKYCWPLDKTGFEFFGFKSTTDAAKKITTLDIVEYNPVTLYKILWKSSGSDTAATTAIDQYKAQKDAMAATHELIHNDLIGQLPVPTGQMNVAGVYRPEQYRQDLEVINIAIAQIDKQKAEDAADAAAAEAAAEAEAEADATALDNETATELTAALLDHSEEEREANTGALVAAIIGGIILIGLLGFCCMRMCMDKRRSEMGGATRGGQGQAIRVNNSSFRSDGGNQGKLDDIM